MLATANLWMSIAGVVYLAAGVFILRKELAAARGWDKLITMAPVFIAVSLATFAPEHFRGPEFVQNMVPRWMPGPHRPWVYFVGCALLAAATSLTARKFMRFSTTLLGLMFFLFVCMLYLPSLLRHPTNRFAWTILLRDLSFCAGAWALAAMYSRDSLPRISKGKLVFSRCVLAVAAIFYAVQHFLHPEFSAGVPPGLKWPAWVPFPVVWAYLAGAVLLIAGVALAVNKTSRMAATSIGALMTALTLFLYMVILVLAHGEAEINEALNYVADTLLYAGAALGLASALQGDPDRVEKT
jgi:uncharacterized membrane protein